MQYGTRSARSARIYTKIKKIRVHPRNRRGREGSYPPSPRTNPGVRNYRTGLFRDTRFRMITYSATNCLFSAVRFAQIPSPTCLDCVSFADCVSLSTPSPCERRYRLRVLRVDPTPDCLRLSYLSFRFAYLLCRGRN